MATELKQQNFENRDPRSQGVNFRHWVPEELMLQWSWSRFSIDTKLLSVIPSFCPRNHDSKLRCERAHRCFGL